MEPLFNKVAGLRAEKNETSTQVFSCEIWRTLKLKNICGRLLLNERWFIKRQKKNMWIFPVDTRRRFNVVYWQGFYDKVV